MSPLDLHVLGTPPAFVLSQDQTLVFNPSADPGAPAGLRRTLWNLRCLPLPFSPSGSFRPLRSLPVRGSFLLARFSSLYRFQGSARPLSPASVSGDPFQASFARISKLRMFVKHFFQKNPDFSAFFSVFFRTQHMVDFFPETIPYFVDNSVCT